MVFSIENPIIIACHGVMILITRWSNELKAGHT